MTFLWFLSKAIVLASFFIVISQVQQTLVSSKFLEDKECMEQATNPHAAPPETSVSTPHVLGVSSLLLV